MKKIILALAAVFALCSGAYPAEKAIKFTQPAYEDMTLYVYKPAKISKAYYATFDGYLVYTTSHGVWNYATFERDGIYKTNYVVGSVVPSAVNIKPYDKKRAATAPILGTRAAQTSTTLRTPSGTQQAKSSRIVYMPPVSGLEVYQSSNLSPVNPDWTQNSNFMAVGKWQKSIDRIGVIDRPMTAVAWKGDFPQVIYVWTGLEWRQIDAKNSYTPALNTLKWGMYKVSRFIRKVGVLNWTDDDTNVLSQYSAMWGYQWMGLILLGSDM